MKKTDLNIRKSYKLYRKNNTLLVSEKDFVSLCNEYHKFLMEKVFKGFEVTLPMRLGTLQILGKKQKIKFDKNGNPNLSPNWPKTKKLWEKCPECKKKKQRVYNTNEHSSGIRYRLTWSKKRVLIKNKILYSFILTRANKREIYRRILAGQEYQLR